MLLSYTAIVDRNIYFTLLYFTYEKLESPKMTHPTEYTVYSVQCKAHVAVNNGGGEASCRLSAYLSQHFLQLELLCDRQAYLNEGQAYEYAYRQTDSQTDAINVAVAIYALRSDCIFVFICFCVLRQS